MKSVQQVSTASRGIGWPVEVERQRSRYKFKQNDGGADRGGTEGSSDRAIVEAE